jgi:hypothetical protein
LISPLPPRPLSLLDSLLELPPRLPPRAPSSISLLNLPSSVSDIQQRRAWKAV